MKIIEIDSSNYAQHQNLDIIAFSFANPGAQGKRGDIKIVTSDGTVYHTNYVDRISLDEVQCFCSPLKDCNFNLFGASVPEGWTSFYMGGGNFLVVKDSFTETITKVSSEGIYNHWLNALLKTL